MNKSDRQITIRLYDHYHNSVISRAAINNLFDVDLENLHSINIDFKDISFISRSAAHQLMIQKRLLSEKNIKITFSNLSPKVEETLNIVEKDAQNQRHKNSSNLEKVPIRNQDELHKFLMEI